MITDEVLMNMIATAERFSGSKVNVPIAPCSFPVLAEALIELKERRASELRPATKFVNLPIFMLMYKIEEEVKEIKEAYEELKVSRRADHFAEELVDLQMVCETILASVPTDEYQRMAIRRKVIEKNKARGYYDE